MIAQISLVRMSIQVFQVGAAWGRERAQETIEEHESIADKILSRQPLEAEELSRAHIRRVIGELRGQGPAGDPASEAKGQGRRSGRKSGPVATV